MARGSGVNVWLGGSDSQTEGTWTWYNGSTPTTTFWIGGGAGAVQPGQYANFMTGEPNDSGNEDYVYIDANNGQWNDVTSSIVQSYIVEWDASEVLSNYTYTLISNPSGAFAINATTGEITVSNSAPLNYEVATSYGITIRVTDGTGAFYDEAMTISINDVDEFDVGAVTDTNASANAVSENASVGTTVGITASANDADGSNNTITYSLANNDGGRFTINSSTGVVTVAGAINREADGPTRNITVRATSADGSFTDQAYTITINDVDEFDVGAVSDTNATANAVNENAAIGTTLV